jgi:hypothetical protein
VHEAYVQPSVPSGADELAGGREGDVVGEGDAGDEVEDEEHAATTSRIASNPDAGRIRIGPRYPAPGTILRRCGS